MSPTQELVIDFPCRDALRRFTTDTLEQFSIADTENQPMAITGRVQDKLGFPGTVHIA